MDSERVRSSEVAMTPSSKKKHWEYPWTVEEMRKAAGQWNLASDVGLFEHLQEFSQKLLSQTHEIQEQVDSLNHDAKLTNIRLHNVFNDFVMLANTQFVENRVYDEEVVGVEQTDGNKKLEEKQEKTQEQKEMELIPKIKEAISLGLNVFDTAYEKLDMNIANSESDDEDAPNRPNVYLEPKDPYLYRPLPCLIGSDQFFQTENLGLGSLLVDEKDDQESEYLSDGEVGGPPVPKPPPLPEGKLERDSDESDEDLFGERKAEADIQNDVNDDEDAEGEKALKDDKANTAKNPLSDFHSELSRKLGGDSASSVGPPPKRQGSVDKEVVPSARPRGSKAKTQHPEDGGDLFPSALDEPTDDIFSRPSRLFSTRPTLFDDDEDDSGGMFGSQKSQPKPEKPAPPVSTSNKPVPASKDPDVRATTTPQSGRNEIFEEKQSSKGKGLFDNDDEEEDLFATKPTAAARQTKETKKPAVSLFDEDDDESDIFSSMNKSSVPVANKPAEDENKNKPRLPAGAVSIFGGGDNLFKAAIQKAKADDNNVDDVVGRSTISDKSLSKPSAVAKSLKPATGSSSPSSSTMSSSSLFAEDPEIFTTKSKSSTADLTKESSQPKAKTGFSLFADDEDDDLFASLSKPVASAGNKTVGKEPEAKKKTKTFLFDDDDEDGDSGDLFALPKSSTTKDEKKNITFVEETAPQKVSIETKPAAAKEPAKEVTKPNKVSLFSGSDDDEDDLFSLRKSPAKTKATTENPPPAAAQSGLVKAPGKRQSLFDDDNFLFNAQDDDGPSVDLFKPTAAKVENKSPQKVSTASASAEAASAPIEKSPPPVAAPRAASTRLFGSLDDDEDDLFSTLMTKSSEKSKSSSKPDETRGIKTAAESKQKPKNSLEDIFGEKATPKEKPMQKEKSAAAEVKGTDVSAVKLFDDPLGSETVAVKAVPKMPDVARAPLSPVLQPQGESDDLFGDGKGLNTSDSKTEQSLSPKSSTSPKVLPKAATKGDKISKLQSSININPTSHLPPKIKKAEPEKVESDVVDFSLPAQTQTLHSLSKDRAKIPIKRRPPTRKHAESHNSESQHNSESHNGFGIETDSKEFVLGYDSTADVKTESVKRQTAGDDLFSSLSKSPIVTDAQRGDSSISARTATISSANDNKTETREPASSKVEPANVRSGVDVREKKETGTSSKVNVPDADVYDDIFAGKSIKTTSANQSTSDAKRGKNAAADSDEDDLFGEKKLLSSSTQAPAAAAAASKTKAPDAKVLSSEKPPASTPSERKDADDDNDDLFGTKALIKPTAPVAAERAPVPAAKAENSAKKPDKGLLSSDDDDIFNVPKNASASAAVKTKAALTVKAAAADDDDDDDIFVNSSLAPKGARKTTGNSKPKVKEPVFDDDDDDIFASIPSSKVKKPVSQPKKEIATDEDDLFATVPPSSSRPASKKLVTKDEDLFHDDTDIFANIPSAKPKEKKSQGKNVLPTGTPLFTNDPDDIFADAAVATKPSKVASDTSKPASKTKSKDDYDDIFDDPLNVLQK